MLLGELLVEVLDGFAPPRDGSRVALGKGVPGRTVEREQHTESSSWARTTTITQTLSLTFAVCGMTYQLTGDRAAWPPGHLVEVARSHRGAVP